MSKDIIPVADQKLVDEAVARLMEHFGSCRVFVTRHDGASTDTGAYSAGGGNFYAQLGQINEWLTVQNQYARKHADAESDD